MLASALFASQDRSLYKHKAGGIVLPTVYSGFTVICKMVNFPSS